MGGTVPTVVLTTERLSSEAAVAKVGDAGAGAICTFVGTTRNSFGGREVILLDYEAHEELAVRTITQIATATVLEFSLKGVFIAHRLGRVPVGQASIVIAVSSVHRRESFAACEQILERIKQEAEIWKREQYADGSLWKENAENSRAPPTGL